MTTIEISPRLATWRRRTEIPLTVLAVGSLPLLLLETVANRLPDSDKEFLFGVEVVIILAFSVDYLVGLYLTSDKKTYVKSQWAILLIIFSQVLALLPLLGFLGILRASRALRIIDLITRFYGIGVAAKERGKLLKEKAASFAFAIAGFTMITSAVAFTIAEDVGEGRRIHSFFDSLWWSTSIITRAGGDIRPITGVGRVIAVFTGVIGISALAVVTGKIAQLLMSPHKEQLTN